MLAIRRNVYRQAGSYAHLEERVKATFERTIADSDTDDTGTTSTLFKPFTGDRTDNTRAGSRMPAFLGLARHYGGLYVENDDGMAVPDALAKAGLDFTVTMHPYKVHIPTDPAGLAFDIVPGARNRRASIATWPDGRRAALGDAGKGYTPVQPAQAAELGQLVLDEGGATVVAAAAYGEPRGSRMYLALKMPDGIQIGGRDPHDLYLTIGNSFNTDTGLWGCVAPIRLRCTNQTTGTFFGAHNRFTLRHTAKVEVQIGEIRRALDLTNTFAEQYAAACERLLATPMDGLGAFLEKLLPTPKTVVTDRGADNWAERRSEVRHIITDGDLNDFGIGTRYAALQGVYEWADHKMDATTLETRYARLITGNSQAEKIKNRAADLLMAGL